MLTFPDMATLDAQFDEAKIAMGEIRSIKELTKSDWSDYWGAVQLVPDRSGGEYKLPGRPWHFSRDELTPIGTPAFQGEHNKEVFGELGVSEADLQRLSETGVLVTHHRTLESEAAVKPPEAPGRAVA
jgi:crotonobetainyl-CoA:carnitine CoA-transferase CaiB-like acyl-CoA transferase